MNMINKILGPVQRQLKAPLKILETGAFSTRRIAKWVSENPACKFESVDLDGRLQEAVHTELECDGTAKFCTFHTQSPSKFLSAETWSDAIFLYPSDLSEGEQEFSLAVSTGARIVVMTDFQRRAAKAVAKAKALGWNSEQIEDYIVLTRP